MFHNFGVFESSLRDSFLEALEDEQTDAASGDVDCE
jgi:hypothetical protein